MSSSVAVKEIPVAIEEIIEWDTPNWSTALNYWTNHTQQNITSSQALEIGSANGGVSLWAALQGMNVLCTDLNGASDKAIQKHHRYGVADQIKYAAVDAMNIPYQEKFDVVLFKSVLGGIGGIGGSMTRENQVQTAGNLSRPQTWRRTMVCRKLGRFTVTSISQK